MPNWRRLEERILIKDPELFTCKKRSGRGCPWQPSRQHVFLRNVPPLPTATRDINRGKYCSFVLFLAYSCVCDWTFQSQWRPQPKVPPNSGLSTKGTLPPSLTSSARWSHPSPERMMAKKRLRLLRTKRRPGLRQSRCYPQTTRTQLRAKSSASEETMLDRRLPRLPRAGRRALLSRRLVTI